MLISLAFFSHFFENSACFLYLAWYSIPMIKKGDTMNTIFSITTILMRDFTMYGAIEDCGGHCLGNEN